MYLYLPGYQGPGRVLWGSPWAPVLEVTVYSGRKPRPGGEPPSSTQPREVIVFIKIDARGLAGLGLEGGGNWRERLREKKDEYVAEMT